MRTATWLCLAAAAALAAPAVAAEPPTVRSVAVDPSSWPWRGDPREALSLEAGRAWSAVDAVRSLNLLKATGGYRRADLVAVFGPGGVDVTFDLESRELVESVWIDGNLLVLEGEITPAVRTTAGEVLDPERARADAIRIRELYGRKGFVGTRVQVEFRSGESGRGVVFLVREGKPAVVEKVALEGNAAFTDKELSQRHGLTAMTFYDPEAVRAAAERLASFYREYGFIEARVDASMVPSGSVIAPGVSLGHPLKTLATLLPGQGEGVVVTFRIVEGQRYDISVRGNRAASTEVLTGLMTFQRSGFFDQAELDESREEMLRWYRENGHPEATVTASIDEMARRARFEVDEGPAIKVARLGFEGIPEGREKELRGLVDSRPGWAGSRPYRGDVVEADLNRVRSWYLSHGYTRAEVRAGVRRDPGLEGEELVVTVSEGPRARVRAVRFEGATVYESARLLEAAAVGVGTSYDPELVEAAKKAILDLYSRLGYADCAVAADAELDVEGENLDLRFVVREGERREVGRVLVAGNRRTGSQVIAREVGLRPGDPFDPIRIFRARSRLFETGLFSRVEVFAPEGAPPGATDLVVRVRERPSRRLAVGLGYDSEELWRGYIEASESNLWGSGRGARLRYKLAVKGRRTDAVYREPWILGLDQDLNVNLYEEFREEVGYDLDRVGLRLYSDRYLGGGLNLYTAYRYETVDYRDVTLDPAEVDDLPDAFVIGSLKGALTWDRRDNAVNPHRGWLARGEVELAMPALGSETRYNRYDLQGVWVQPAGKRSELVLAARLGIAQKLVLGEELPLSERFFAGGASTVRGYRERGLGPRDAIGNPIGGDLLLLGNLEWRQRLWGGLGMVLFLDAGNVWSSTGDFSAGDIKASVGVGGRYETPVGPARLEVGWKLSPAPGEESYRVHFTLGHPF